MESKRNNFLIISLIALCVGMLSVSCGGSSSGSDFKGDTVTVEVVKLSDTSSFTKGNGDKCGITSEATIAVPTRYKDAASIETLRKLFVKHILYGSDSLNVDEALKQSVSNTLHQYDFSDAPSSDEIELDNSTENVQNYSNSVNISVYYNTNNIITFCKVEVVKKDSLVTSVTHRYYSFDLENMSFIGLGDLFREDALGALCNDMRSRLMASNKVSNNDQLNEIGYFNIDNLTVTRNFYFDDNGITWSFMPNELAVEALGEPTVSIEYDALVPYLSDKSVIKRLY